MATNQSSVLPFPQAAPRHRATAASFLRALARSVGFALALTLGALDYAWSRCFDRLDLLPRRARWCQRCARMLAWVVGLRLHRQGVAPASGMIVSNHLSYLDILAYSALLPCVFVAKKEVASWPVLGWFARLSGTIFVDRNRKTQVGDANEQIAAALRTGVVVILFAEGTSSDGQAVLPFRSSLLEPVTLVHCPVTPAALLYHLDDGSAADEVCYWGDMTLPPHLFNLFSKKEVQARVAFGPSDASLSTASRKNAARHLESQVVQLWRACGVRA